ncbi:hypothetical protein HRbin17_02041 [bacterium HR17]|uniref:Right handed beta helix domain-containing protein n=1 Tax=Candidatus Fervidibacter japonicus TaxID=2035412 RepID=A0A2H5XEA8_9BACT|nr:hypothetical protein HRbin17_02041 [bacterium HR17]
MLLRTVVAVLIAVGAICVAVAPPAPPSGGLTLRVANDAELRDALRAVQPGTTVLIAPGEYRGGLFLTNLQGTPDRPILIAAADPTDPPVIKGGTECLHLVDAAYVELRDLVLVGASGNGLNIDDGGSFDTPAHHIVLRNLKVRDIGPQGNCDGIKLSGVTHFRVENCVVERWGDGGQGIDMVGCHDGVIVGCTLRFEDEKGFGIQAKGGSSRIRIVRCRLEHAGARAVQLGGSTGLQFFRPPLRPGALHAEARDLTVEGCTVIGSTAAIAFAGVDGAVVQFNTIYRPKRWAFRILQETRAEGFVPCRNGVIADNLIVFRSDEWAEGGVNIGPHTAPHTFTFARNWWFCLDDPARSRPRLPVSERDGVYGVDPRLRDPERGNVSVADDSPARKVGAHAFTKQAP